MIDVAFRSETEAVVRKATPVPALCFDLEAAHRDNGNPKLFRPIGPASSSLEVLGSNLFLSKWTWSIFNDHVPSLYRRDDCSLVVRFSVEAVGLATMGLVRSDAGILNIALQSQIVAMKR